MLNFSLFLKSWIWNFTGSPWALALCLTTNLAMGQSSKSSDIHSVSIQGHRNWAYFCSMGSVFRDNGCFWHAWPKFQKCHIYSLSPRGSKLSSFSLYRQRILRYWPNFKTVIFRHEFQKLHIYSLSNPGGQNWANFCSTRSGFQDTGHFANLPYLGIKLRKWPKFHKLHMYPLSTPGGWNWAYFCSTGSGFRDTGQFSKLPYLGMKLGKWPKSQKLHIYPLSTPGGRN